MSLLNITNLTKTPREDIVSNYIEALEYYKKENPNTKINDKDFNNYIEMQIDTIEDYMNESKGSELLAIIDNFLVNNDYYADVKEFIENQ